MRLQDIVAVCCLVAAASPVFGQPAEGIDEVAAREKTLDRVLALRVELEELLATLPAELREEAERRWRELEKARAAAPAGAAPAPAPAPAPPALEPAVSPPPSPAPTPERTREAAAPDPPPEGGQGCRGLRPFDSNEDGVLSGADRYWRYFSIWIDSGDGRVGEGEIIRLIDLGIREISLSLRSYTDAKDRSGDIWVEDFVYLDLLGKRNDRGALLLDAERLARNGELKLLDARGAAVSGVQPLTRRALLASADGESSRLVCR